MDEASVSCRSRYGADMIFYNPRKPSGKFHFRFYMLCCSTTYACVRLRIHTRNKSDVADAPTSPSAIMRARYNRKAARGESNKFPVTRAGRKTTGMFDDEQSLVYQPGRKTSMRFDDDSSTDDEGEAAETIAHGITGITNDEDDGQELAQGKKTGSVLLSLIMDMCEPLFGSGRVVNMDNYYTSPMAAWMLSQEKVYMRGTCRTNRVGFPGGVSFNSKEKNNWERGTIRAMIDKRKGMAAFGWLDGNPVHFITTADGSGVSEVRRRVGRERRPVKAPMAILQYNKNMQAVDRHDQLREGFSLSDRHGFKKYYHKIALGLIDMAIVNAWIHYKLVNSEKCRHERARYEFMDSLANSFLEINWQDYYQNVVHGQTDDILRLLTLDKRLQRQQKRWEDIHDGNLTTISSPENGISTLCAPIAVQQLMSGMRSKKKGLSCQVCSFEGRGGNITCNVVACPQHRIRACTIIREDRNLKKKDGTDVTDYTWRAAMPRVSCWDKMHKFYIPKGLFRDKLPPTTPDGKMVFQCCCVGSTLYRMKKEAMGEEASVRGKRRRNNTSDPEEEALDIPLHAV